MRDSLAMTKPDHQIPSDPRSGLSEWIGRHQVWVWRYLRYLGCETNLAEDLCQDCFLAALDHRIQDRSDPVARAWLRTTARNSYLTQVRKEQRHVTRRRLEEQELIFIEDGEAGEGEAYQADLRICLGGLGERARRILHLRYHDNCPREEIARSMNLSEEGAKTLLRRVKNALRSCIEKRRTS
jgi:RNA polymerase sigma factor (sigma-70 family)